MTMDGLLNMQQVIYIGHAYQRTKCILFLFAGPDFITDLPYKRAYAPYLILFPSGS